MPVTTRNLNIAIVVEAGKAEEQFKAFKENILREVELLAKSMQGAFANVFGGSINDIKKLTETLAKVQTQMKAINDIAYQSKGADDRSPLREHYKMLQDSNKIMTKAGVFDWVTGEKAKKSVSESAKVFKEVINDQEKALLNANKTLTKEGFFDWITGKKAYKSVSESARVFKDVIREQEKAFAKMRSHKTTPYEYMPIKHIIPSIEKQLPHKSDTEKQLYSQLSTAEKIIKMTQDRIRDGLLTGSAGDVKAYIQQMLDIADQVSPQLRRRVANIFRESGAMEIVREYNKHMKEIGKFSEITGIKPDVVQGWKLTTEEIIKLTKAFERLKQASEAVGIEKVNKFYRDVISNTVVKGSGKELGMIVTEKDIENIQRLKKDIPEINNLLANMGIEVDKTHGRISGLWASAKNYMKFQISWFVGAGIIFSVITGLKELSLAAMEFAQTLKNIQAVTGATNEELNMISNSAKRISIETPMAATEVANLGLQLIRAGLDAKDAAAAMDTAAKVAVVSGEDAKTVADTVATVMMAWKIMASETGRIGNVIAAAMNYSRLTVQDLGTAFNYVAGVASSFNRSLEETTAILAVYSNLGVRASTIATGWTQLMSELLAPSKKAVEYITSLTDRTTGLKLTIESLNPITHSFSEILKKFENAGFDAAKALDIFQVRAGRALLSALRAGSAEFANMEKKIRESKQLQEGLARVMEGPIAAFKKFWNQIQASAIQLGSALMPVVITLTNVLQILSTVIYHNIHLLTSAPAIIIAVASGVILLTSEIRKLMTVKNALMLQGFIQWLSLIPPVILSITKGVDALRSAINALIAAMPGGWIAKILAIGGGLAAGAAIDKMIFGDSETSRIAEMKNKIDETRKNIERVGIQFKDTEQIAGESINEITTRLDDLVKHISDYKIPEIKITADVKDVHEKFQHLIQQSKELNEAIKLLEGKILNVGRQTTQALQGNKGVSTLVPYASGKTPFDVGKAMMFGYINTQPPTVSEQIKMTHWGDKKDMERFLQKLKQEAADKANKTANAMQEIQSDALKRLNEKVRKAVKRTAAQQYNELAEEIANAYAQIYMSKGYYQAEQYLNEGAKKLLVIREQANREASKGMVKDYQRFINDRKQQLELTLKNIQTEEERIKNAKEIKDETAKYEFEVQKASLDRLSMLNDEYYNMGIKLVKDFYDEKLSLIEKNAEAEIAMRAKIHNNEIESYKELLDIYSNAEEKIKKDMSIALERKKLVKEGSQEYEAYKSYLADLEKAFEEIEKKIKSTESKITKENIEYERAIEKIEKAKDLMKEQLTLQRAIKDAQEPYQRQLDTLNIEKEKLQVMSDAFELTGNWNDLYRNRVELQKLEGQIRENEINKRIAEVGTKMAMSQDEEIYERYEKEYEWLLKLRDELIKYNKEQIRRKELMITAEGAIQLALEDTYKKLSDINKNIYDAVTAIASAMENAFMNFFDVTSKEFMKFGRLAKSILYEIYKELIRALVVKQIVGAIVGAIPISKAGMTTNTGGANTAPIIVPDPIYIAHQGGYIPRYHFGGLASDEVPAILQRGEYVVSRKGVATLDAINEGRISQPNVNVVVKIENKTSIPFDAKQGEVKFDGENYIVGVILKNIDSYGPLRHAIAGVR